jgi:lipoprotein signal peptidase
VSEQLDYTVAQPRSPLLANFLSPGALLRFYGLCLMGLMIDLLSKYTAQYYLEGQYDVAFIPGYIHFKWVLNPGAVFGIGAGMRWLFVVVSVFAFLFLTYLFASSGRQRGYQLILGLLMAGVLGNLYDRVFYGHVRDMIWAFPKWPDFFPYIFNVADIFLCTGVALMLLHAVFVDLIAKRRTTSAA